jgi:16S rRNA C1402 (ribose-2'-O) methylase RsmI
VEEGRAYEEEGLSRMDAIKRVARERGVAKNELYKLMLEAEE